MRRLLLDIFMLAVASTVHGQTVSTGALPPIRPTEKVVYDSAYAKCFYEYEHRDSKDGQPTTGQTVLLIGRKFCGFMDYYSWRADSINDACYREGKTAMELFALNMTGGDKTYPYPLVKSLTGRNATMRIEGLGTYEYNRELPSLDWEITEKDSLIEGSTCTKALCEFGGRTWEAWFSTAQPIPVGPYVFDGLPGLVYLLRDADRLFEFRLNGLVNTPSGEPIYLKKIQNLLRVSRADAWKAYRNECNNPLQAIQMNMPGVIVPEETARNIKQLPYCPIELE